MFHAFAIYPDGKFRMETDPATIPDLAASKPQSIWIDLDAPDEDTLATLQKSFRLDDEAVEDCVSGTQRARIDDYDDYQFLIVYGPLGKSDVAEFNPRKLGIFFCDALLITVHVQPLLSTAKLIDRVKKHREKIMQRGAAFLLYSLIDSLADNYLLSTSYYDTLLDRLEDQSLDQNVQDALLNELAVVRRTLGEMRRSVNAHRELALLLSREEDLLPAAIKEDFGHVVDHLRQAQEQIEVLREHVYAIQQNHFAVLAEQTNRFMRTLTLFATFVLPLSLVTGFYGMNIPLWPDPGSVLSSLFALGVMGVITGAMFFYFKWKKLL